MPPRRISPDPARGIEPVRTGSEYGMIEGIVGGHVTVFFTLFCVSRLSMDWDCMASFWFDKCGLSGLQDAGTTQRCFCLSREWLRRPGRGERDRARRKQLQHRSSHDANSQY